MAMPMDSTVASQVPFHDLSLLLEKTSNTQGKEKKKDLFRKFLDLWRDAHRRMHDESETTTDSFFSAMRLFLPHLDKERLSYGMKEVVLAKYYIDVLNIAKESPDAKKLLNYRAPTSARQDAGDFAAVAYIVLKNRCPEKGRWYEHVLGEIKSNIGSVLQVISIGASMNADSLTIEDVNSSLDIIAQANAEKKRDVMKKELQKLIRSMSAMEQELKVGLNENSIFSVFHPDAHELYNVCSSLSKVCVDLRDPKTRMNEAEITLFTPFRPMLGQRAAMDQVEKLMDHEPFYIETKIDGERMQLHKRGNEFRYFSRSSNDYSESFGVTKFRGTLTPFIGDSFYSDVDSCILDGEMVGYDPQTDLFVSKGTNLDIKSDTLDGVHPCFVVFDILLLNGEKLANLSLKERISKVEKVFKPVPGRLQHVERYDASTKAEVVAALNDAIDKREEGIVVKQPQSTYRPSQRKGSGWLKLKPEYVDSLSDQLDLIITGGYFGSGKRGGMVSHFLLGVAAPPEEPGGRPSEFHSFCKVGSGYTLKELRDLCEELHSHWRKFNTKDPPTSVILSPGFKEKPDVWIEPANSKIVQIKAAEITTSEKYKCGYTLRFPRLEKVRDDKNWFDCMDLDELHKLRTMAEGRLTYRTTDGDASSEPSKKKRRVAVRVEKPRTVADHFKGADISSIKEISSLFEDKEFCIINGPTEFTKHELEKKIAEHGGTFVQNPTSETYCVVADKINVRVKNIISRGDVDIVYASWLVSSLNTGEILPFRPSDMIHVSPKTSLKLAEDFDEHGDSYTEDVEPSKLKEIFADIEYEGDASITDEEIAEIEFRYFPNDSHFGLFRRCKAYMDNRSEVGDPASWKVTNVLDLSALEFRFYGGTIQDKFENGVSHVVVDKSETTRLSKIRSLIRQMPLKPHIVTEDWITDSIEKHCQLEERNYEPQ